MRTKKLGCSDLDVSVICLGTMDWGGKNSEEDAFAQMDMALDYGVNFFDTAEAYPRPGSVETYGRTEEIIGNWFSQTGKRDKIIIASKVTGPGVDWPWIREGTFRIDRENIQLALEDSLRRLKTDVIDLYQLHWPNRNTYNFGEHWNYKPETVRKVEEENFFEVLVALDEHIKAGKIRYIGVSNETAWGVMTWLRLSEKHNLPRIVSIQNEYSLLLRLFDLELAEVCQAEDVGLISYSPIATGLLSGKYLNGKRPVGSRWEENNNRRMTAQSEDAVKRYVDVAKRHDLDPVQMALSFVINRPFMTSAIMGVSGLEQFEKNVGAVDLKLDETVLAEIERAYRAFPVPF